MNTGRLRRAAVCAKAVFLLAVCGMILVWTGAAQAAWRLRILPAACAAGERVMLKEIAVPDPGFPEDAWAILGATALWAAPAPGQSSIVSQAELPGALRAHLREAPVEYQLPTQLLVRRGGRIMYRPELENLVVDFLTPHLAGLPGQASVAGVETPEYLFFGENDRVVVELAGSGATVGAGPVDLRLAVTEPDGRAASKVVARAVVSLMARVAVARRPVNPRDGVLTPELVSFEKRNVAGLKGAPWDGSGAVRLVRGMGQGQIVLADDVEPMPLVQKGDKVTLVYEGGRVRLAVDGLAESDGVPGGPVTVRNLQSERKVTGSVRDKNTVVISANGPKRYQP